MSGFLSGFLVCGLIVAYLAVAARVFYVVRAMLKKHGRSLGVGDVAFALLWPFVAAAVGMVVMLGGCEDANER